MAKKRKNYVSRKVRALPAWKAMQLMPNNSALITPTGFASDLNKRLSQLLERIRIIRGGVSAFADAMQGSGPPSPAAVSGTPSYTTSFVSALEEEVNSLAGEVGRLG
jgi:hypothetical protein